MTANNYFYRFTFILVLLLCCLKEVSAQDMPSLQYDAEQRLFTLVYTGWDGILREVQIIPPNHIQPEMRLHLYSTSGGSSFDYNYELANRPGPMSRQVLFMFLIDCPDPTVDLEVQGANGWGARHLFHGGHGRFVCDFYSSGDATNLPPGDSLDGFVIRSTLLPQMVEGRFFGLAPELPARESSEEMVDLADLEAQATGIDGGWYPLHVVSPGRSPEELAHPVSGVAIIQADLVETCELGWITNPGVCNSLRVKLEQAGRALERGNDETTIGQLQAFLNELEAQHGDEPGKHVNDNAYWLLKVNVEFILARISAG